MNRLYTGNEHFTFDEMPTNRLLSDFLSWISLDLMNTATRSVLAEYIVSAALDLDGAGQKSNEPFKTMFDGVSIEIKSSAYIQTMQEDAPLTSPIFGIAPTYVWNDNEIVKRERKSQLYVFCLLDCLNRATVDPLRLEQWKFYVLPTSVLNEHCGDQKTLTLNALKSLNPTEATYETLKQAITDYAERK